MAKQYSQLDHSAFDSVARSVRAFAPAGSTVRQKQPSASRIAWEGAALGGGFCSAGRPPQAKERMAQMKARATEVATERIKETLSEASRAVSVSIDFYDKSRVIFGFES